MISAAFSFSPMNCSTFECSSHTTACSLSSGVSRHISKSSLARARLYCSACTPLVCQRSECALARSISSLGLRGMSRVYAHSISRAPQKSRDARWPAMPSLAEFSMQNMPSFSTTARLTCPLLTPLRISASSALRSDGSISVLATNQG